MHRIEINKDLTYLNSLQLPSLATAYAEITQPNDLLDIASYARSHTLPLIPLGEGSNIVLGRRINAMLIKVKNRGIQVFHEDTDSIYLRVAAGENWHSFVSYCLKQGWYGLENLALIPGTVGAAPVQNIGAYGVEISSFITRVSGYSITALQHDLQTPVCHYAANQCQFSYRNSLFKTQLRDQFLISHIELKLNKVFRPMVDYPALRDYLADQHRVFQTTQPHSGDITASQLFAAVVAIRQRKLPDTRELPNAGSFFQNPILKEREYLDFLNRFPDAPGFCQAGVHKIPAAWLIEQCGYKGKRSGALGMHSGQALVMVNHRVDSHVSLADGPAVLAFAREIADTVKNKFELELQIEPRCYGC